MGSSTGGDGGPSGGGILNNQLTGKSPPTSSRSVHPAAGLNTSRLLALFEECVDQGVWASLETVTRQGAVNLEFCCRIEANQLASRAADQALSQRRRNRLNERMRARNVERTREWREIRRQHRQHPPPTAATTPPTAHTATMEGAAPASGKTTAARTFAAVAAQPAQVTPVNPIAATEALNSTGPLAASSRGRKVTSTHPAKRAKNTLVASRVSKRAALLSKRREATNTENLASPPIHNKEEEEIPEVLRGTDVDDGEWALEVSLGPSSPPPPPLLPATTPPAANVLDNNSYDSSDSSESGIEHRTDITEADFLQDVWEGGHRLNTRDPSWETVFPFVGEKYCRFCHKTPMKEPVVEDTREYECEDCFKLTTLQLIVKHAVRSLYPTV